MKQKNVYLNQEKTFSLKNNSNSHGYFITYPWIFHYVSMDISLNIREYFTFSVLTHCFSGK